MGREGVRGGARGRPNDRAPYTRQAVVRRNERTPHAQPRRTSGGQANDERPLAGVRPAGPPLTPGDPELLARDIRAELRQLGKERADRVAGLLVAAGQLVDEDPARALNHARAAREMGSRVGVVREAVGLSAYHAGEWAEAARELRAAARITGSASYLPVIADCERALGRPERAIDLARGDEAKRLTTAERVELAIVEAGARRDLGQLDAARLTLEDADLARGGVREWSVRLWYAYADTLLALDRREEAAEWFRSVVAVDEEASTDAEERLAELEDGRPGEEE